MKTCKLKLCPETYTSLNHAAKEVTEVWNWANTTNKDALDRDRRHHTNKWLSAYDLQELSAGASQYFDHIGSNTIQRIVQEYAQKRDQKVKQAKKEKRRAAPWLKFRVSSGPRRSLGWVPFVGQKLKRKGRSFTLLGKTYRVFNSEHLPKGVKLRDGCFAQDSVGDWYLCLPIELPEVEDIPAPNLMVGIDLGCKTSATMSDGQKFQSQAYRDAEKKIANLQRRGHKKQAKRIHRKVARQRKDKVEKFTTDLISKNQNIFIGNVSSAWAASIGQGKASRDSAWGMIKARLTQKGQQAGRRVEVVNEAYTTQGCHSCGSLTGPKGSAGLGVREWQCGDCGTHHDRDVNAARNIALTGLAAAGLDSLQVRAQWLEQDRHRRERELRDPCPRKISRTANRRPTLGVHQWPKSAFQT